jgi:hypothetical protein
MFPGFDGLLTLSRREGVDIRPTLLRVLTDLYVQTAAHTAEEEQHFVELTSRLIDQVDDATRAAVRARLSIYPQTPAAIMSKLRLHAATEPRATKAAQSPPPASLPAAETKPQALATLSMEPRDGSEISQMFFAANARERVLILQNLATAPLRPSPRIHPSRAARAIETLHMAAFASDVDNFVTELGETLILPARIAERVVKDPGGEPLACAVKAIGMSVITVYRLSRLYDLLDERSARILLAVWRGATMSEVRAKYRPALYHEERHRARTVPTHERPGVAQPDATVVTRRTGRDSSGS